jgi:hypothetical protein
MMAASSPLTFSGVSSNSKTRFVARVEGSDRLLFSVQERASGDLTIIRRAEKLISYPQTDYQTFFEVAAQRLSIHRSLKSSAEGTTFKRTTTLANGSSVNDAAFIKGSRHNLLWPAWAAFCPDMSIGAYEFSVRTNDRIVRISENLPQSSTLIYHVFITEAGHAPVHLEVASRFVAAFKYFDVVVYANYLNLPYDERGATISLPTSEPSVDGDTSGVMADHYANIFPSGSTSLDDHVVKDVIFYQNEQLCRTVCHKRLDGLEEHSLAFQSLYDHEPFYSALPFLITAPTIRLERPAPWTPEKLKPKN